MQQQFKNCLREMSQTFVGLTADQDQPQSLNAQAVDFIPNAKSSAAVSTVITKLDEDKRFFYRNGALYNRMCIEPLPSSVRMETNVKQTKDRKKGQPLKGIKNRASDDVLLITDSDLDDEYEAGYNPMDAPIPNARGLCFQNLHFQSDENMIDEDISSPTNLNRLMHSTKTHEKDRFSANPPPPGFADELTYVKGPYIPLQQHRLLNAEAYGKAALERSGEEEEKIEKSRSSNLLVNQRGKNTNTLEPIDDDEILRNLRKMVDNLLMDPVEQNQMAKHLIENVCAPLDTPIVPCVEEKVFYPRNFCPLSANKRKGKTQHRQASARRGQGGSRSSGFTEMFGYSPPTFYQQRHSHPRFTEVKRKVAAKPVGSLFNGKPRYKDFPILTLPTTQRRLARKENFDINQTIDWTLLPMGER